MKKAVFKQGDRVKITCPDFIVRWGYPLTISDGGKAIESAKEELDNFLYSLEIDVGNQDLIKLKNELSYLYIKSRGFGGNNRAVYTNKIPSLKNTEAHVLKKRIIRSGSIVRDKWGTKRFSASGTHIVLNVEIGYESPSNFGLTSSVFRIEAKNVEKI